MALSSALYAGVSGLSTLGNSMQIIGNNVANINTLGFKACTPNFQDLLSQEISTMSGTSQVGKGTALGDIYSSFEQGSFETTGNTTDLAIAGDGFFHVRDLNTNSDYLTRAGNFRFDKDGYLINPEGYILQGWQLDADGNDVGSATDIVLNTLTTPPEPTDLMEAIVNLDSDGNDNSSGSDTALSGAWDGTLSDPVAQTAWLYQTRVKVFDALGSSHDVTVYFDKAATGSAYEYIVTCNPSEDNRTITQADQAGLLARGLVYFDSSDGTIDTTNGMTMSLCDGDGTWSAATLTNGHYTIAPTFVSGNAMSIELDFGTAYNGTSWVNSALSSTQYARTSTTDYQSTNGYGAGDLQGVNVDPDGVMWGSYSNGQVMSLYRVANAMVKNVQGLSKEGNNLYSETRDSGTVVDYHPGTNGTGSVAPNSLEKSNVDIAAEFVKMITTQRGFQANSKTITVTDQMLAELIQLKR